MPPFRLRIEAVKRNGWPRWRISHSSGRFDLDGTSSIRTAIWPKRSTSLARRLHFGAVEHAKSLIGGGAKLMLAKAIDEQGGLP